ncbi:MAG: LysM peptidoglycan-binding domain-containing protein [Chloroflexi bacterium]|nr:LysM peptidoglycan-binding domain-containing protein [Chloroflexota bacterium]
MYTLEEGDTLRGIAAKFGVAIEDLIKANNIANPDLLFVGQQIVITGTAGLPATPSPAVASAAPTAAGRVQDPTTYTLEEGDTLRSVAAKFGVSVEAVARANGIDDPDSIQVGRRIDIPAPTADAGPAPEAPAAAAQATTYTIEPGDTLKDIAARFGMTLEALLKANKLELPDAIEIGQKIAIPR